MPYRTSLIGGECLRLPRRIAKSLFSIFVYNHCPKAVICCRCQQRANIHSSHEKKVPYDNRLSAAKSSLYYAVLYLKVDGKRKTKWIKTKRPVRDAGDRKARNAFEEIRSSFEREAERRLAQIAAEIEESKKIKMSRRQGWNSRVPDKWLTTRRSPLLLSRHTRAAKT